VDPTASKNLAPTVSITFPGNNRAQAAFAGSRRTAETLLADLGLAETRPVVLVIGGAESMDPATVPQLETLFERGAVRAAGDAGATVLDGGTASGVMEVLGRAAAASDESVSLVGVAPAGLVTYPGDDRHLAGATTQLEPNHSHFLLANSSKWGGETSLLIDVVDALARAKPACALLAGGGPIALEEVRAASQQGLPVVVVTGTGGVADALASGGRSDDPNLASVGDRLKDVASGAELILVPLAVDPADLAKLLARLLGPDETLRDAWQQHALVSGAARRQQRQFRIEQTTILILAVALTTLVVTKSVLVGAGLAETYPGVDSALHIVIVLVPIMIATLAAAASRMRPGSRWVLLRGTAETIKREIFRYRTRSGIYSNAQTKVTSRAGKLSHVVESAMGALMRTDVNQLALDPSAGTATKAIEDDRLSRLTPDDYLKQRIADQIGWYRDRVGHLDRQVRTLRWLVLGFGAMGTFLAAIGLEIWVAVTTALAGAYVTYLESWQLESALTLYNQAATDLGAIRSWWLALPPAEQARQETTDRLVDRAERIMRAEHVGWVQEMQDAMTQLRLEQAAEGTSDGFPRADDDSGDASNGRPATRTRRSAAARVGGIFGGRRGRDGSPRTD
jgi:hypothetical protein